MNVTAPAPAPGSIFRLIYRSHDLLPVETRKADLGELFSTARSNNKARDITGALLVADDWFVQTLEGDESAVRALFSQIEKDPRHDSVAVLEERTVDARVFSRWAMAKVAADGEPDIPLISNKSGITPAAGRAITPEQESILQTMRDAARSEAHTG